MKGLIEKIIQWRNPHFQFDNNLTSRMLLQMCEDYFVKFIRGFSLLGHGKLAKGLFIGKSVQLIHPQNITFGKMVKLGDYVKLAAAGQGTISIGNNTGIGDFSRIIISTSYNKLGEHITIGNQVGIGEFAYLGGAGGLSIGDECIIGQYFSCHPENHHFSDIDTAIRLQGTERKGITVGKNCWIGSKVSILDGVEIGESCVIAAGAVVTKSMPSFSVIGGVPARVIKSRLDSSGKTSSPLKVVS